MKFVVEIELGNDAMQTGRDVADVLAKIATSMEANEGVLRDSDASRIMDANGNTVGFTRVER